MSLRNYLVPSTGIEPVRSGLQPEALPTELQGRNVRAHQDKGGRQARTQF